MIENKPKIPVIDKIQSKNIMVRKLVRAKDKQTIKLKQTNFQFEVHKNHASLERIQPNEAISKSFMPLRHRDSAVKTQKFMRTLEDKRFSYDCPE
jgi:hypothetical protein